MKFLATIIFTIGLISCTTTDISKNDVDSNAREVLQLQKSYVSKLRINEDKKNKCSVIYNVMHSNSLIILESSSYIPKLMTNLRKSLKSFTGKNSIIDVSDYMWPYVTKFTAHRSSQTKFKDFCNGFVKSNLSLNNYIAFNYQAIKSSSNNNVVLLGKMDNRPTLANWKKENDKWKLYSVKYLENNKPRHPSKDELYALNKIIWNSILLEKTNKICTGIASPLFTRRDVISYLSYIVEKNANEIYTSKSKLLEAEANKIINEMITEYKTLGGCELKIAKYASFMYSIKLTNEIMADIKKLLHNAYIIDAI